MLEPCVITAERPLRAVNAMITGFHEPHATHLAMVRQVIAAAGSQTPSSDLDRAYREAQEAGYLWHEFGDSHLILGGLQTASAFGSASSSSPGRV